MKDLSNVVYILSDETLLIEQAISSEKFSVDNLLKIIENRALFNPDFFMFQFENGVIYFYEKIKQNSKFKIYAEQIKMNLQFQMSEEIIGSIKVLLKKIQEDEFLPINPLNPIVKKLI